MIKQAVFFDVEERLARLSGLGDQLEAFSRTVDFEVFRPDLEKALAYSDGSKGGRPPFNPVLMFKILMIQTLNNVSDERTEYLINDRLSFMRFLGLGLSDRVPDAKTLWKFRFIRKWKTTHAAASDGARLRAGLLDNTNTASSVWAEPFRLPSMRSIDGIMAEGDTAYRSKANEDFMEKQGFVSKVHRKKPHLKPMPRRVQRSNAGKLVLRSRVEHVFADQKSQTGLFIRTVGITRATMRIGLLVNIVYNMRRFLFLKRLRSR
ncbi:transposase [Gluconobacter kondonii]|uniref:transposase n=1 Tax=Gluconobacter kondonii TaxID=941463 RepID=UPI0038D0C952